MPFDLEAWKIKVRDRLHNWRGRMQQVGVDSIYAFLSAATLWPVVEAAQTGDLPQAYFVLGGVLAGVGGNLLANRIQGWKDEADAARQLAAEVSAEPTLRDELDAVLQALGAVTHARDVLSKTDRQWFTETLQAELKQLGNASRFAIHLKGSGAAAMKGGVAASGRGVAVRGKMQGGTIATGDNIIVANVYTGPSARNPGEALAIYQRVLTAGFRHLSLRGLDVGASDPTGAQQRFELAQLYVEMLTTT